jgi:hypothetical protein
VIDAFVSSVPGIKLPPDLELFLVGLVMAATVYCDGLQVEDPTEDFDLWRTAWDAVGPAWEAAARERGWRAVGMNWEYHHEW